VFLLSEVADKVHDGPAEASRQPQPAASESTPPQNE